MAKVNIDILGISDLKLTGMGEFNSDDHYIYHVGKNPLGESTCQHKRRSWEDPRKKEMAAHSSILAGKCHGQRRLVG